MGKRLRVLVVIFSLVICYALYYIALPKLMNLEDFSPILSRFIKLEYGYNVKFEKPIFKMGYLPSIWIKADKFIIFNNDKSDALRVDEPVIKISILPLILKKTHIRYFSAKNIYMDLYCDDKLNLSIGEYLVDVNKKLDLNISNSRIYINDFNFNLNDTVKKSKIVIDGKYFNIDKYADNKYLDLSANFDVISKNKRVPIIIDIDTKLPFNNHLDDYPPNISVSAANLDFSDFANYIKYLTHGDISDIRGVLNFDIHSDKFIDNKKQYVSTVLFENIYIKSKLFEKDYKYSKKLQLNSEYLLYGSRLDISVFDLILPNTTIKLGGSVNKIDAKNPVPNLNLKINNANATDLIDIMPYCDKLDKLSDIYISILKDADFHADVNVNLDIKDNFKRPKLYGDVNVTNAYVERPIHNAPKNADIKLKYLGEKLDLNVYVPTDLNQYVSVKGKIDAYDEHYADLHITSTPSIDLSEAERVLMPVHRVFDFLLGPVPIMKFSGYGNIDLIVKGTKKDAHTFGYFRTNNATVNFDDIPNLILSNASSVLNFNDTDTVFHLTEGNIAGKKVYIDGDCNLKGKFNFVSKLHNQNAGYLLNVVNTSPMLKKYLNSVSLLKNAEGFTDINLNINGQLLDINNLDLGKNVHFKGDITLHSIKTKLANSLVYLQNISGLIKFNDFNVNLNLNSILGNSSIKIFGDIKSDNANLKFKSDRVKVYDIARVFNSSLFAFTDLNMANPSYAEINGSYNGSVNMIEFDKIKANGAVFLKNCKLIYKPEKLPITIINGQINVKNNDVYLSRVSAQVGTMPSVFGGKISNIFTKPYIDISLFSRPNQKFLNYIYNSKSIYPLKIKGNMSMSSLIYGYLDRLNIKSSLHLDRLSKIYFMGATLGGDDLPIEISSNVVLEKDKLFIKSFLYDKILENKSHIRQLSTSGYLIFGKVLSFNNFKVITFVPTDMKIFNILFKKPFIKKGNFTSDIVINGPMNKPDIRGNLALFNVDIPFLDASIKNVSLRFLHNSIIASLIGDAFENSFRIDVVAKNSFQAPFVINNAKIDAGKININSIYNSLNDYSEPSETNVSENESFDINNLIIKKLYVVAEEVIVNMASAKKLSANIVLDTGNLTVDRFNFNLANGKMDGYINYNFKSKLSKFDLNVNDIDANMLANSLAGLDGQIYGNLNGQLNVSCHGENQSDCFKSLDGHIAFRVKDGKMPKLGSLEYLLKAGNLVKSGITGLSVNNLINLVAPLHTGSFSEIKGTIDINKGVADKIQILSNSKDLNLFIIGEYNLVSKFADMYVFGRLSRKISTVLGPVGNLSLNTLFNTIPGVDLNNTSDKGLLNGINKIPGLELTNRLYRVFAAEIHGDISGDDYVESFRWIE